MYLLGPHGRKFANKYYILTSQNTVKTTLHYFTWGKIHKTSSLNDQNILKFTVHKQQPYTSTRTNWKIYFIQLLKKLDQLVK